MITPDLRLDLEICQVITVMWYLSLNLDTLDHGDVLVRSGLGKSTQLGICNRMIMITPEEATAQVRNEPSSR